MDIKIDLNNLLENINIGTLISDNSNNIYEVIDITKRNIIEEYSFFELKVIKSNDMCILNTKFNFSFNNTITSLKHKTLKIVK